MTWCPQRTHRKNVLEGSGSGLPRWHYLRALSRFDHFSPPLSNREGSWDSGFTFCQSVSVSVDPTDKSSSEPRGFISPEKNQPPSFSFPLCFHLCMRLCRGDSPLMASLLILMKLSYIMNKSPTVYKWKDLLVNKQSPILNLTGKAFCFDFKSFCQQIADSVPPLCSDRSCRTFV